MSKLFSCFWQCKNKRDLSPQETVRSNRRQYKGKNDFDYVKSRASIEKLTENKYKFNSNVSNVYRSEINSQAPGIEQVFGSFTNRQSHSYPASPERRSLYKVYSDEHRLSFEKQGVGNRRDSKEPRTLLASAANAMVCATKNSIDSLPYGVPMDNIPRRSTLSHVVDYENELLFSEGSPRCLAQKQSEQYDSGASKDKPILPTLEKDNEENKRNSALRRLKVDNKNYSPRSSIMGSENVVYLATDNMATEPMTKTVVRARPGSSKDFILGSGVKPMIYRADNVYHPPMSAGKYIHQMPIKANKHPHLLTTPDGKILKPLTSDNARRLSSSSNKGNQPRKLSVIRPLEPVEDFPLAQREVLVAAPMIGGGRSGRRGRSHRQSYYDGPSDMYPSPSFYGAMGGYDGGYGYYDDMGGYGCDSCSKRRKSARFIYAAQMPDVTLPDTSFGQVMKTDEPSHASGVDSNKDYCDLKDENLENTMEQSSKGPNIKFISSSQQTDKEDEPFLLCFSPERFFRTVEDPHSKMKWRIVIKREDKT